LLTEAAGLSSRIVCSHFIESMFDFDFDSLEDADLVDVRVCCLDGNSCRLSTQPDVCIRQVKDLIEAELAIAWYEQRLCCGERVLGDNALLPRAQHVDLTLVRILPDKDDWICRVRRNPHSLSEAPLPMKAHPEVVRAAAMLDESAIAYAVPALRLDCKFILPLVRQKGWTLRYLPAEVQADYEVVLAAVQSVGQVLKYASAELRANTEIVCAALRQDARAGMHVSPELFSDPDFIGLVIDVNPHAAEYVAATCPDPKLKEELMNKKKEKLEGDLKHILSGGMLPLGHQYSTLQVPDPAAQYNYW